MVEAPLWVDREAMAKITKDLRKSHAVSFVTTLKKPPTSDQLAGGIGLE